MSWYEIIFRLFLAIVLSGIIGFERELHGRPAGLRTHVLVVSGIGFLGAGTILRDGGDIKGITMV